VGSTPIPVLENLANDKKFKGKLIIDVTEGLFFSASPQNSYRPVDALKYYKEETPAQWASFHLNHLLESQFAFLDKERLSLNAELDKLKIPSRPGVFVPPIFASGFGRTKFSRQDYMTGKFLSDTAQQNQQRAIWALFGRLASKEPPVSGPKLDSVLNSIKILTDKIKARGGQVIFVRSPSSGPYFMGESMGFPRAKYWDRILAVTGCPGIHFSDYPAIANFQCPEFSHLAAPDVIVYTKELIRILNQEKGWQFAKLPVPVK
jgi:hypothetical protein